MGAVRVSVVFSFRVERKWIIDPNRKADNIFCEGKVRVVADDGIDINKAIILYLKHYPGNNDLEFESHYGAPATATVRELVRAMLDEAMTMRPDWKFSTLNEAGDYVESVMHDRHPELSSKALERIGNYFTYLMR